jgi:Domain of unknown function (DUF5049)
MRDWQAINAPRIRGTRDPLPTPRRPLEANLMALETVRESGETNMQDPAKVQATATRLGYPEVAAWIEDHPHEYQGGIFRGFVTARQSTTARLKDYNHV